MVEYLKQRVELCSAQTKQIVVKTVCVYNWKVGLFKNVVEIFSLAAKL